VDHDNLLRRKMHLFRCGGGGMVSASVRGW
jgi:hypothetical protein